MTVKHFTQDNKTPFCGTKPKKNAPVLVKERVDVTCKKCRKAVTNHNHGITFHKNRKHGFYLEINRQTILRLGNDVNAKIGMMMMLKPDAMVSTSSKFASGNLKQFTNMKTLNYLKKKFNNIKENNGNYVRISDVKEEFELEKTG